MLTLLPAPSSSARARSGEISPEEFYAIMTKRTFT